MVNPNSIFFYDRCQYLFDRKISLQEGKAIRRYLELSKDREEARLREIVIDSCQMSDEVLAEILAGAAAQVSEKQRVNGVTQPRRQYLWSFVYTNNTFGIKSLEALKPFAEDLLELRMNNVGFDALSNLLFQLTEYFSFSDHSPHLMKFALNNVKLAEPRVLENVIDIFSLKPYLQFVDLSWRSMSPRFLEQICE